MLSLTHAAIAVASATCLIGTANPFLLGAAAISSQLPDVDTTKSYIGLALYPIARWIEDRYPHRTITHSFLATIIVAVIALPLWLFFGWQAWAAVALGYFMGWFADCFTKNGVAAFYPNTDRLVIPGNPKARLKSGSSAEYWLLATAIAITVISYNLISNGGLSESFARSFFNDADTASEMFKRYGSSQQVLISVEGLHNITNEAIKEDFKVIAAAATTSVVAKNSKGILYQIGNDPQSQIKPTAVKTVLGEKLTIKSKEEVLENVLAVDWINSLPPSAYVTGSIIIDNLADFKEPLVLEKFAIVRIFAGQIEVTNGRKKELMALLGDQYILEGRVIVKVRSDE